MGGLPGGSEASWWGVQVEGVRKEYNTRSGGRFTAADGVDLQIQRGGMTALLGPSGSGEQALGLLMGGPASLPVKCSSDWVGPWACFYAEHHGRCSYL